MINLPFGFQIGRPQPAPQPSPQPQTFEDIDRFLAFAHKKRTGSTGTEIYSGYPVEDYLAEMRGVDRARLFDEMYRTDGQIRMLVSAVMNPIRSASWEVEAADDSPEATLDKLFVEHCLMGAGACKPFDSLISEIGCNMIKQGASAVEKTYKLVQGDPMFGTYHGIAGLDLISNKTIDRWNVAKGTQKLLSITQISNGDLGKGVVSIPAPYLMIHNIDQEGANYEGISMLRSIYGNWLRKGVYLKLNAIGSEKYAVPTPLVKIPSGFEKRPDYNALITALEDYTSGQANFLIYPEGIEIDLNASSYDPEKLDKTIDAEDRRMAKAWLANFLELGMTSGGSGSFALGQDLSDFFLGGIEWVGKRICEPFNLQLIPELVRMNRGPRAKYPKLKVTGISDKAGKELAEILDLLIKGKVVVPDDKLEESMRKRFNLPQKSLIGQRDVTPPAPMGFGGAPGAPGAPPTPGQPSQPGASKFTFSEIFRRRMGG